MKPGKEYEIFIFEKLKKLFSNWQVILNDKVIGQESGIKREIDVSIRGKISDLDILYIVQCKDHNKPADVKIIGEFSSVIKDVGASKGFLICTSGFTKTIHQYAKSLGIELLTVEDINSDKWKIDIEIPITYIYKEFKVNIHGKAIANDELAEKNKVELSITYKDLETISFDNGKTSIKIMDHLNKVIEDSNIDVESDAILEIKGPNLRLFFAGIWIECSFKVSFEMQPRYYVKYVKPEEYSQISDHLTNEKIPLSYKFTTNYDLNDGFIEIENQNTPVRSTVFVVLEENLRPIKELTFDFSNFEVRK